MSSGKLRFWSFVVAWTVLIGGALFVVDRGIFGPVPAEGWTQAESLATVPAAAGSFPVPPYFPRKFSWPPRRVFYRVLPSAGIWVQSQGVGRESSDVLWIGTSDANGLAALGHLQECAREQRSHCPPGWYQMQGQIRSGTRVRLLTNISERQAGRIMQGLVSRHPPAANPAGSRTE